MVVVSLKHKPYNSVCTHCCLRSRNTNFTNCTGFFIATSIIFTANIPTDCKTYIIHTNKSFCFGQELNLWFNIFPLFSYTHCWRKRFSTKPFSDILYATYVLCKITVNKHSVLQKHLICTAHIYARPNTKLSDSLSVLVQVRWLTSWPTNLPWPI